MHIMYESSFADAALAVHNACVTYESCCTCGTANHIIRKLCKRITRHYIRSASALVPVAPNNCTLQQREDQASEVVLHHRRTCTPRRFGRKWPNQTARSRRWRQAAPSHRGQSVTASCRTVFPGILTMRPIRQQTCWNKHILLRFFCECVAPFT